jgi:hypothetical protein
MRKIQQAQILALLKTLEEAHGELRKQTTASAVTNLLADCQDFALQIKEFVETATDEETKTASLLEEYCELAYRASLESENKDGFKKLANQLTKIESSVRDELKPNRVEVVFFPYQLSMWDSLESVYFAAKDDPGCDAYVVPIPWLEKHPDGTFGETHCDGDQYPDDIPITDWREYDVEARHPDVIFIHNPYDEGNYVSSVHPNYYSKRLRECTDLLCYVPYFVIEGSLPEHFAMTAACVYADKVFVQSEKIREAYIRLFSGWVKENKINKNHPLWTRVSNPSAKFVAIGSPKFDKIINTKRENELLPAEWRALLDGKKAVFYNTTVGTSLVYSERYLKKLRTVLATFKTRDDAVLWWRPHPLMESTLASMRPELLDEYRRIVADYQREGWGIYDDSSQLHRAIAWSDAYYGDASSIIAMYGMAGKPIMVQAPGITTASVKECPLVFVNVCEADNDLWFCAKDFNALIKMDKKTWETEYMGSFPCHGIDRKELHGSAARNGEKLYFAPLHDNVFYAYDLSKQSFEVLPTSLDEEKEWPNSSYNRFYSVISYERFVFYIGFSFKGLVRYDTETGEMKCCDGWVSEADQIMDRQNWEDRIGKPFARKGQRLYFTYVCVVDNRLYCPFYDAAAILVFDMDTCRHKLYQLDSRADGFGGIIFGGSSFWLAPTIDTSFIVKWDESSNKVHEYDHLLDNYKKGWAIAPSSDGVLFLPYSHNTVLKIDYTSGEASETGLSLKGSLPEGEPLFSTYSLIDDMIYLHGKGAFLSVNTLSLACRQEEVVLAKEQSANIEQLLKRAYSDRSRFCQNRRDCLLYETQLFGIDRYLDCLDNDGDTQGYVAMQDRQAELFKEITLNADGTAGKAIYSHAMNLVKV